MNIRTDFIKVNFLLFVFHSLILCAFITACSSSSSGSGTSGGGASGTKTASLGTSVKNVPLTSGIQSDITFTYSVPGAGAGGISKQGDFSIDVTKTLENMTLSFNPIVQSKGSSFEHFRMLATYVLSSIVQEAFAADGESTAQVIAHLSFAGDPNVCSSETVFGPYSITGMIGSSLSSDTQTVTPNQAAVDIINAGSFEVCLITTPPIDAYVTLTGVSVDFEPCEGVSLDITGEWSGTYSCDNFGLPDEGGNITLTISRNSDGSFHYVDDGGASYDGHLCGNKFKFNGGIEDDYDESGTFLFSPSAEFATKTSSWKGVSGAMSGTCADTLSKVGT